MYGTNEAYRVSAPDLWSSRFVKEEIYCMPLGSCVKVRATELIARFVVSQCPLKTARTYFIRRLKQFTETMVAVKPGSLLNYLVRTRAKKME